MWIGSIVKRKILMMANGTNEERQEYLQECIKAISNDILPVWLGVHEAQNICVLSAGVRDRFRAVVL
jgi:hypothetical protein